MVECAIHGGSVVGSSPAGLSFFCLCLLLLAHKSLEKETDKQYPSTLLPLNCLNVRPSSQLKLIKDFVSIFFLTK